MQGIELYLAILVMAVANYFTRVFPFLFYAKKEPPSVVLYIEKFFPPIIMTILIFYSLNQVKLSEFPYGSYELLSILFILFLHLRFNNYLVSIIAGTLFYMGLVQYF